MVFFTCSHCGESLKKNKVEKHYHTICRGKPVAVTCVDCCKDFNEQTVTAHTKCLTEEERYAAKGFTPKPSANKGERKQQRWQDVIRTVKNTRTDLGQSEIQILALLVNQENVPRKRNKFQNYLKTNLHGRYKEEIANRVFDILEEQSKVEEDKEMTDECQQNGETEEKENVSLGENNEEDNKQQTQTEKLSKKERKELKKKAKYEAQLKEIENEHEEEAVEEKPEEEDEVPKKSKKSKKSKEVAAEEPVMENGTEGLKSKKKHKSKAVENGAVEEEQHKSKKKRKKETAEEEEEEPAEKKAKDAELQEEEQEKAAPKQKFNWEKAIVSLLEARDDKELSLKRLKKKVLAELESCGETNTEKNLTKFNKKIHKIPAIVILKDKVRLKAA